MIDLERIEALDAEAHGVDLYGVALAWCHVRDLGLRLLDTGQLHPARIVLRPVPDGVLREYRVARRLPVHQDRVARHLLDAQVARWMWHCEN